MKRQCNSGRSNATYGTLAAQAAKPFCLPGVGVALVSESGRVEGLLEHRPVA
jgi:hypothetical protein